MRILVLMVLLAIISCRASAGSITLASGGKSDFVIVVPDKPSASEALAAEELAGYIERMSGARLPVRHGGDIPDKVLIVCEEPNYFPLTGILAPGRSAITGDDYSIALEENRVFLVGGRGRSVLYAVYDFLGRLGCRWLAPNFAHYQGSAEYVPKVSRLTFSLSSPVIEKSALAVRKLYVEEGHSHNAENLAQMVEWMPKARFSMLVIPTNYQGGDRVKWDNWREKLTPELEKRDIVIEVGGHGYQNFLNAEMEDGKLFEKHPEWFGMDAEGKRRAQHGRVFCLSNADAANYLISSFISYIQARPEIRTYAFWPPDGASWCECPNCTAIGVPADQQAYLLDKVREAVSKVRPDLRLEIIAYAKAVAPPEKRKLDKSVLLDFCPIGQCFEVQIFDPSSDKNAEYAAQLQAWRKAFDGDISIYSYYRKYAWVSLPVIIPHYMQTDLQWYAKLPVQGVSSYAEPGDWFTYELNHYVLGNLAWNTSADVDALIGKFCKARYGSAAKTAISTFAMMEDVIRHNCSIPGTSMKSVEEYDTALGKLSDGVAKMKAAQSKLSDAAVKRNIDRLLLAMEYARLDIEVQKARTAKAPKAEIRERALAFSNFAKEHKDDGVIFFHQRLDPPRLYRDYGVAE